MFYFIYYVHNRILMFVHIFGKLLLTKLGETCYNKTKDKMVVRIKYKEINNEKHTISTQ